LTNQTIAEHVVSLTIIVAFVIKTAIAKTIQIADT